MVSDINMEMLQRSPGLSARFNTVLGPNALNFMGRMYHDGLSKYKRRLMDLGFAGRRCVLDAGTGVGQWAFSLASLCDQVYGIDVSPGRIEVCQDICRSLTISNVKFAVASLESMSFPDKYFDGAICYGVLNATDYPRAISEISRTLKDDALLYLSANAMGRYVYDIISRANRTADYNPSEFGLKTVWNTVAGKRAGFSDKNGVVSINRKKLLHMLELGGFQIIDSGPEGTIGGASEPFLRGRYLGVESTFDVLARKN